MKFPNTVSLNTYSAYIIPNKTEKSQNKLLNAIDLDWDLNHPDSLRFLCIKQIAATWETYPFFAEIHNIENRNYLLDLIDVNIPIKILATHIKDDVFWRRCFENRWRRFFPIKENNKPWIEVFMEKYLCEIIETMKPSDYIEENIQSLLEICGPHVKALKIVQLQPSLGEENDHIPFDCILSNLPELRKLDLTFDIKNIGNVNGFFLGCATISKHDIKALVSGLETCFELVHFRNHSTRLDVQMLKLLARALDKAGHYLSWMEFSHCQFGDAGLIAFLDTIHKDSFPQLKHLILKNNGLSKNFQLKKEMYLTIVDLQKYLANQGILEITRITQIRIVETLDLRLNPIGTDGAGAIFGNLHRMALKSLNLSCCSIDNSIEVLLLRILKENTTLKKLNMSANSFGLVRNDY